MVGDYQTRRRRLRALIGMPGKAGQRTEADVRAFMEGFGDCVLSPADYEGVQADRRAGPARPEGERAG